MRKVQAILDEATADIKGLRAAFIGDRDRGLVVAAVNLEEINIQAVAAYATELLRANLRFSKLVGASNAVESLWSVTASERFYIRMIPETECYVAFVVNRSEPFYSFLTGLEKVLKEARDALPKLVS